MQIRRCGTFCMALLLMLAWMIAPRIAHAQNLVSDPTFINGLRDYQTVGQVGTYQIPDGPNAAGVLGPAETSDLSPGLVFPTPSGVAGMISQSLMTTPDTLYMITFSMAHDTSVADSILASFGNSSLPLSFDATGLGNGNNGPNGVDFQSYSFTGLSTGTSTLLSFTANDGGFIVTGLDAEPAPAPVAGAGIASFGAAFAALAAFRIRRRQEFLRPV